MINKKILWIEDDAHRLMAMFRPLEAEGYTVVCASDEISAIEHLKNTEFGLIVLDIILPTGKDGEDDVDDDFDPFVGSKLAEKIVGDMKLRTPILGLSVVNDEKVIEELRKHHITVLPKGRLLPSALKNEVKKILEG